MLSVFTSGFRDTFANALAVVHGVVVCISLSGWPLIYFFPWLLPYYAIYMGVIAVCLLIFGRCPLTILEAKLRGKAQDGPGFVSTLAKKVGVRIPDKLTDVVIWLLFVSALTAALAPTPIPRLFP